MADTFAWSATGGSFSDAAIENPVWTAPLVDRDTAHDITCRVTRDGTTRSDTRSVTVKNVPTFSIAFASNYAADLNPIDEGASRRRIRVRVSGDAVGEITASATASTGTVEVESGGSISTEELTVEDDFDIYYTPPASVDANTTATITVKATRQGVAAADISGTITVRNTDIPAATYYLPTLVSQTSDSITVSVPVAAQFAYISDDSSVDGSDTRVNVSNGRATFSGLSPLTSYWIGASTPALHPVEVIPAASTIHARTDALPTSFYLPTVTERTETSIKVSVPAGGTHAYLSTNSTVTGGDAEAAVVNGSATFTGLAPETDYWIGAASRSISISVAIPSASVVETSTLEASSITINDPSISKDSDSVFISPASASDSVAVPSSWVSSGSPVFDGIRVYSDGRVLVDIDPSDASLVNQQYTISVTSPGGGTLSETVTADIADYTFSPSLRVRWIRFYQRTNAGTAGSATISQP